MEKKNERKEPNSFFNRVTVAADMAAALFDELPKREGKQPKFDNYEEYLANNAPTHEQLEEQRENAAEPSPLISIAIVAKECSGASLDATLISLMAQTYTNWEACIMLGLEEKQLKRFNDTANLRVVISSGTEKDLWRQASAHMRGAYILQLRPGDILSSEALYLMMQSAISNQDFEAVFADEDALDDNGNRCQPIFKPEYGNVTVLTHNSIGSPLIISKRVFEAIGGFVGGTPLDRWQYAVRALRKARKTQHIARILLSSRNGNQWTDNAHAADVMESTVSGKKTSISCSTGKNTGTLKINVDIGKEPQASIIIPNIDSFDNLKRCVESIEMGSDYSNGYRIYIADDRREDAELRRYLDTLKKTGTASLISIGSKLSLPQIINHCAKKAINELLIFVNGSCEVTTPRFIDEMKNLAMMRLSGAVGGKLIGPDGRIISVGEVIGINGWTGCPYRGEPDDTADILKLSFTGLQRNVSAVSGAFMAIRGDIFMSAGMFDETLSMVGWDTEFCIRLMRRGYMNYFTPYAEAIMYGNIPSYGAASKENLERCYDSFRQTLIEGDKYYNPNFDYASSIPSLAVKPYPAAELNPFYQT